MEKLCVRCKEVKDVAKFGVKRIRKSGHVQYLAKCKDCTNEINRSRKAAFKEAHPELFPIKVKKEKIYSEKHKLLLERRAAGLKKCYDCGEIKPLDQFRAYTVFKTGKKQCGSRCKQCDNKHNHTTAVKARIINTRVELTAWVIDYKKNSTCVDCGLSFKEAPWLCDFHHRDPTTKSAGIANLISSTTDKEVIIEEINKCDTLCANCHRTRHNKPFYLVREIERMSSVS